MEAEKKATRATASSGDDAWTPNDVTGDFESDDEGDWDLEGAHVGDDDPFPAVTNAVGQLTLEALHDVIHSKLASSHKRYTRASTNESSDQQRSGEPPKKQPWSGKRRVEPLLRENDPSSWEPEEKQAVEAMDVVREAKSEAKSTWQKELALVRGHLGNRNELAKLKITTDLKLLDKKVKRLQEMAQASRNLEETQGRRGDGGGPRSEEFMSQGGCPSGTREDALCFPLQRPFPLRLFGDPFLRVVARILNFKLPR